MPVSWNPTGPQVQGYRGVRGPLEYRGDTTGEYPDRKMSSSFGTTREPRQETAEGWSSDADKQAARKSVMVEQLTDKTWKVCSAITCTVVGLAGLAAAIAAATAGVAGGKKKTIKRKQSRRKTKTQKRRVR